MCRSGLYCLILELCGDSVQDMLDSEGSLSPRIASRIIRHTLRGLVSAHGAKIVHRDIKPANLVLADESMLLIKIIDFGIAAATERGSMRSTFVTGTAGLAKQIGTPHFMSPEAFGKGAVDHRTDIWSVGVTFYYLLTGKLPFDKQSGIEDEELSEMEVYHNVRTVDPF